MTDQASDNPASTEPLTLVTSRIKWWVIIVASVGFAAVLLVKFNDNIGAIVTAVLCVGFAGLCTTMLFPGSGSLRLDEHGFQVTHFFRTRQYRWSEVSDFGVHSFGQSGEVVAFKTTNPPRGLWNKVNGALLGNRNAYLPDTYGMTSEDLAKLMTARQSRA